MALSRRSTPMTELTLRTMPADLEAQPDPYRWLGELREAGPVQRVRMRGDLDVWAVTRYDDVLAAMSDSRLSSDPRRAQEAFKDSAFGSRFDDSRTLSLLNSDPPDHTWLRRLVSRAFTARRVEHLRPRIQEIADELLDDLAPRGSADLVADYAFPLPVNVICELLGVPFADRSLFRHWSTAMLATPVDEATLTAAESARADLSDYLRELVADKRTERRNDLISDLIDAGDEQRLSDDELVSLAVLLLIAGHETTVNLIGTGTLLLLQHPDQLALLRADPARLPLAIEEFLRFDGPVMLGPLRYTSEDVEIGGVRIPAGQVILLSIGAANRDPARFDRPDAIDVMRIGNPHVGFGHGIHFCLGSALARVEGKIAIGSLIRRFPDLALAVSADVLPRRRTLVRGLETLPVSFTPPREVTHTNGPPPDKRGMYT
jgi:cytochrome P450